MGVEYDDESPYKSRSQKKRESSALQKMGEALAALSPGEWKKLALPEDLAEALGEYRTVKTREAGRRQMQYIGRLMRELDDEQAERIAGALQDDRALSATERERQHRLEALRDKLLSPSPKEREAALASLATVGPAINMSRIAHLCEAALADKEKGRPPKHARELFRYLRDNAADAI